MSPGGAVFVPSLTRAGTNLRHSQPPQSLNDSCGLSTVVTPAGASLTMYREIRSYANSIWDNNNNNNMVVTLGQQLMLLTYSAYVLVANPKKLPGTFLHVGQSRSWSAKQEKQEK